MNHVTLLISEQFSESWSDNYPFAKLSKQELQNKVHPARNVRSCVHAKKNFLKFSGRSITTSPSWYQNSFRNHDQTIRLLRNWANMNYRTGCTPPETCVLACTHRKNSRVLFSIGIVCPNIEKAREVEKIEFECLGAMQGPVHSKCVRACVHRPLHDPLTLEFNFSNWSCLFYVRKDYASWK